MTYTQTDYERERTICDKAAAYAEQFRQKNGWIVIPKEAAAHTDYAACDNAMRGRVERFEIFRDKPARLYAYLNSDCTAVTTWPGDNLGSARVEHYRTAGGKRRVRIETTIAGARYKGFGEGAGMFCNLRRVA